VGVVLSVIAKDSRLLQYASARIKADRTIVLTAVSKNGWDLIQSSFAQLHQRDDKDIVLAAIGRNNGFLFRYASDRLKKDQDILLATVRTFPGALAYVSSPLLLDDTDLILAAVKRNGVAL
jgi:hypothetical protein